AGLFINPNFGYAAPNANPVANNGLNIARAAGLTGDPVPLSAVLLNRNVLNNPAMNDPTTFIAPLQRTVSLHGYDDFNYIITYHPPTFDIKYNGGVQGYNYYLNYSLADTGVRSFVLPGNATNATVGLSNLLAFPGCAACGIGGTALPASTP